MTCPARTCCSGGSLTKQTKLALLYLESIGNPPKFARTARRVGRTTPVLTVAVGRSATGKLLAGARAAKVATWHRQVLTAGIMPSRIGEH